MSENDISLFEYNEETGQVEYVPSEEEIGEESAVVESGLVAPADSSAGSVLPSEMEGEEIVEENEVPVGSDNSSDGSVDSVLDNVQIMQALLASTPASGSLSSSTIDYFDRLVSGLPSDYAYVAYRNDADDSYAGTIIYGGDYDVSGDSIVFGEGAKAVDVYRRGGSGYQNYITYDTSDASDSVVTVSDSGTILYYTNAFEGYPVLGNYYRPVGFSSLIVVGLLASFATCILSRLFNRNRG